MNNTVIAAQAALRWLGQGRLRLSCLRFSCVCVLFMKRDNAALLRYLTKFKYWMDVLVHSSKLFPYQVCDEVYRRQAVPDFLAIKQIGPRSINIINPLVINALLINCESHKIFKTAVKPFLLFILPEIIIWMIFLVNRQKEKAFVFELLV